MDLRALAAVEWDFIVVGTGMGGATVGHALARSGRKVLFLEKGQDYRANPAALKGDFLEALSKERTAADYANAGRSNMDVFDAVEGRRLKPILGVGTGGSTALYGMVMDRFWPQDFEPRRHHPQAEAGCSLPERWPISFQDLEPYYRKAEKLFGVTCRVPDPLRADQSFAHKTHVNPHPRAQRLMSFLGRRGYHPYSTPLALDWAEDCRFCQSYLCDKGCKNDAAKICLTPAQKEFGAQVLSGFDVFRLEADEKRVTGVLGRFGGQVVALRGKTVILAAGALLTPVLLLRSVSSVWPQGLANRSGLVGRNLMRHYIDLLAIFSRSPFPKSLTLKDIAMSDFYVVDGEKLGTLGSFGHLPPTFMLLEDMESDLAANHPGLLSLFRAFRPLAGGFLSRFLSFAAFAALILEDLPYPDNRVTWREVNGALQIAVEYKIRDSERRRLRRFRGLVKKAFFPNPSMLLPQADNLKFLAHACGTCRFGDDPTASVLDKFNRAHDLENLYVVDASFFPSSAGTNPSLTIAANALRVADHLTGRAA